MASASEQFAANLSPGVFAKAKDLQKRLLFTLMALIVYRIGTYVPVPGVNIEQLQAVFSQNQEGGIMDRLNLFAGGAVERMAIFALNVMPYISASIIMQMMQATVPRLQALKKEGEAGRKQINQYTRYLTVVLAIFQAYGIAVGLEAQNNPDADLFVVVDPGLFFRSTAVISLVGGTMFLMWLGEQITARGVGNGISLIIFAGIVAEVPKALFQVFTQLGNNTLGATSALILLAVGIGLIVLIVFIERSQRRLLVQYPKRQMAGGRMSGGEKSYMPLKLNTSGVIPPIFASSLLLLPTTAVAMWAGQDAGLVSRVLPFVSPGHPVYISLYGLMIIFFAFFYTSIVFNPEENADNLRKYGGFLPGIRPGKRTADYLDYVLTRLTFIGAFYLAFVCVLPELVFYQGGFSVSQSVIMVLSGMSLLIMVSVTLDTIAQIQSHLIAHQYEGLIKKSKMRGRGRVR